MAAINDRISKAKKTSSMLSSFNVNPKTEENIDNVIKEVQKEAADGTLYTHEEPNNEPVIANIEQKAAEKEALTQVKRTEEYIQQDMAARQRGAELDSTIPSADYVDGNNTEISQAEISETLAKLTDKDLAALRIMQQTTADTPTYVQVTDALTYELQSRRDKHTDEALAPFLASKGVKDQDIQFYAEDKHVTEDVISALSNVEAVKNLPPEVLQRLTGTLTQTLMLYDQQSVNFMQQCVPTSAKACRDCGFRQHCEKSLVAYKRERTSYYISEDIKLAVRLMFEREPNYANMTYTGLINTLLYKIAVKYIPEARSMLDAKYTKQHKAEKMSAQQIANLYNQFSTDTKVEK